MRDLPRLCLSAFGFLSILPLPKASHWDEKDFGRSAPFFPLVGLVTGALSGALFYLANAFLPAIPRAALVLIFWILLSGGLHWDGLADCFDGFCYAGEPARRLEIMKDSRLGTYGALGLFCALLLKFSLLCVLPAAKIIPLLAFTASLARWGILALIDLPLANPHGMAAALKTDCPRNAWLPGLVFPLLPALFLGWQSLILTLAALLTFGRIALLSMKKIGGISGDVLGMSVEISEIIILAAALGCTL